MDQELHCMAFFAQIYRFQLGPSPFSSSSSIENIKKISGRQHHYQMGLEVTASLKPCFDSNKYVEFSSNRVSNNVVHSVSPVFCSSNMTK
jgi:hypothetical protein